MPRFTQAEYQAFLMRTAQLIQRDKDQGESELDDEGEFHQQILDYLRSLGVHGIIHSRMDQRTTLPVGVPDFLCVVHGKPVAMEAKVKGRKPRPEQLGWLAALSMDGWLTGVVRNMQDVAELCAKARTG